MLLKKLDAGFRDKRLLLLWLVAFLTLCLVGGLFEANIQRVQNLKVPAEQGNSG